MVDSKLSSKKTQIAIQKQALLDGSIDILLSKLTEFGNIEETIKDFHQFRDRIFNPLVTLLLFVKQLLSPDKSCNKVVAEFIAEQSRKKELLKVSSNTGPYCKARQRLSEVVLRELIREISRSLIKRARPNWQFERREIKAVDGTTVKMADTLSNQASYPQHGNQKQGVGFPMMRLLVLVSLTVGIVVDYATGAYQGKGTGEQTLLRRVFSSGVEKSDILLGDRYYPCFFLMADLIQVGADGLFPGQSQRHYDFRKGEQLGKKDHIVQWKKPQKPTWMTQKCYDRYPSEIKVREFEINGRVFVTTFLDSKKYNKKSLLNLYTLRWQIELNLNSIKTIMAMDFLRCKTPEMVLKEIGIHFLAYNLIRVLIVEACHQHNLLPREVSFKGTVQLVNSFIPIFLGINSVSHEELYRKLLELIIKNKVGNRPGRVEPRVVKQRKKPFKHLKHPRHIEKRKLKKSMEKRVAKYAEA